jgi:preprotein translocase subunit SecF
MDSGQIASIVAVLGLILSILGVTGIDSTMLTGFVNGVISIITIGAALWSWFSHRDKSSTLASFGIK